MLEIFDLEQNQSKRLFLPDTIIGLQSGSQQNELFARSENELYRLTYNPPELVERNAGIEIEFGGETVFVDPNEICIFGSHPLFNPVTDPMGTEGLTGLVSITSIEKSN